MSSTKNYVKKMTQNIKTPDPAFPLVTSEWLAKNIALDNLVILDASWHMPATGRNGREEFISAHIKGARFFDIDSIKDNNSAFPHMAPSPAQFEKQIGELGIDNNSLIIVYDSHGIFTAPRAWWHFRYMGHKNVFVLDGGLKNWLYEGREIESGGFVKTPKEFKATQNKDLIKDFDQILGALNNSDVQILDARSNPRFRGLEPEPRAGLKSGHIKGSKNVHYALLINEDGTMKSADALREIFSQQQIAFSSPIIASCGSGVTACIIALALEIIGKKDIPIYDGSWSEWGARDGAIIESESE